MATVDEPTLRKVQELFRRYERELRESDYSENSKHQRILYAQRFVDWLSDDYSPSKYRHPSSI